MPFTLAFQPSFNEFNVNKPRKQNFDHLVLLRVK